jgi:hypothetical protein
VPRQSVSKLAEIAGEIKSKPGELMGFSINIMFLMFALE